MVKMYNKKKPIKRNENIVVLSHEHHHGLIFCSRLKKAKQTNSTTLKLFILNFWKNHMAGHFENEEKLILPLVWDNEIISQFLLEHDQIKAQIYTVESSEEEITPILALELANQIHDHIRFEERIFFPWLEKNLSSTELTNIGNELNKITIVPYNFSPQFWKQ